MSEKTPPTEPETGDAEKEASADGRTTDDKTDDKKKGESNHGTPTETKSEPEPKPEQGVDEQPGEPEGEATDRRDDSAHSSPPPKRSGLGLRAALLVALVVVLVLLGGGYWQWSLQHSESTQLLDRLDGLSGRMEGTESQMSQLQARLQSELKASAQERNQSLQSVNNQQKSLVDTVNQLQQQNQRLRERVDAQQKRLQSLTTTSREDWLLAEAEYLLKLANQRVMLERAPQNAIALLDAADNLIRQVAAGTGDAELFAVREAISEELAALKLVPELDKEGIYLRLQALAKRVNELPRVPASQLQSGGASGAREGSESASSEADAQDGWWRSLWRDLTDMAGVLDNYIRIDDAKTPESALISGHAAQMAALNVRIAVEQAQVALLKEEETAFQSAIQKADQLIAEHYVASEAAQRFRADLQSLSDLPIASELPDISESLQLLNAYIERLHKLSPPAEGQL